MYGIHNEDIQGHHDFAADLDFIYGRLMKRTNHDPLILTCPFTIYILPLVTMLNHLFHSA